MSYRPLFTTPSFNCTYGSASNQSLDAQYGIGGAFFGAIGAIQEANQNWNNAYNYGMSSGNHWALPNGTHHYGDGKLIKSDSCIRYEPSNGFCSGVTKDGHPYSYTK
jgi:hypothetical protein